MTVLQALQHCYMDCCWYSYGSASTAATATAANEHKFSSNYGSNRGMSLPVLAYYKTAVSKQ
jgi:hypothetical protein